LREHAVGVEAQQLPDRLLDQHFQAAERPAGVDDLEITNVDHRGLAHLRDNTGKHLRVVFERLDIEFPDGIERFVSRRHS